MSLGIRWQGATVGQAVDTAAYAARGRLYRPMAWCTFPMLSITLWSPTGVSHPALWYGLFPYAVYPMGVYCTERLSSLGGEVAISRPRRPGSTQATLGSAVRPYLGCAPCARALEAR